MKKQLLTPQLKRQLILIAVISLLLASALEIYVFGFTSDFMIRWLRSFFVFFVMISVTKLAIVPAVNNGVNRIMKW
ncbi:DUF2798 domain-containing protein [Pontibacter diazotrophicus]|uniref:DUF2798 domain-containing protein n=1 Tax=Pontibacter diazotrophicus TaxID=1400979 RepID=A0A3D8LE41_9BACT|nr:DUF2798 domain-containing protein [Pontibacter diazotrophicus]RDV15675.1 DUF2798 domain-containing protein [Pontibacter diazotrophicus]